MSKSNQITEEVIFGHFLDHLDGQEDKNLQEEIKENPEAAGILDGFKQLHERLGDMRLATMTPGGTPPRDDEEVPSTIGEFKVLGKIGEGGMGCVFKAFDPSLNRVLAIKVIKKPSQNEESSKRFHLEAQAIAKINHPGVIGIYSFGEDAQGSLYIAMEYMKGGNLRDEIREKGPVPPAQVLELAKHLAGALEHTHQKGILHRDIKPDNLLCDSQLSSVKFTDFGLAKSLEEDSSLSLSGDTLGTIAYMSPEQLRGNKLDARSDIFSLGVTLLELLTGERPFREKTPVRLTEEILKSRYVRELRGHEKWRGWDGFLSCLEKCIASDPNDRYASCAEFAASLPAGDRLDLIPEKSKAEKTKYFLAAIVFLLLTWLGSWWVSRTAEPEWLKQIPEELRSAIEYPSQPDKTGLPIDNSSLDLAMKISKSSGLHPDIGGRLSHQLSSMNLGSGYRWSSEQKQGVGQIKLTLSTRGANLIAELSIHLPEKEGFYDKSEQRLGLGLNSLAKELKNKITLFLKQNPL